MKLLKIVRMGFLLALIGALLLPTVAVAERMPEAPKMMQFVLDQRDATAKTIALQLNKTSVSLAKKGKTYQLKVSGAPAGQKIYWESSNKGVATVSSTGKVKAVAPGNIYIAAYTADNAYAGICKVTVKGSKVAKLSKKDMYIKNGKKTVKLPTSMTNVKKGVSSLVQTGPQLVDNYYVYDSLALFDTKTPKITSLFTYRVLSNNSYNFAFFLAEAKSPIKTNRGVAVGTTWSKALKLYGQPTYAIKNGSTTNYYYELPYGDLYKTLEFSVKSKKITSYMIVDYRYVH